MITPFKIKALAKYKDGYKWFEEVFYNGDEVYIQTKMGMKPLKDVQSVAIFTGILDKEGVEIYTGDLIPISVDSNGNEILGVVEYRAPEFVIRTADDGDLPFFHKDDVERIWFTSSGNIADLILKDKNFKI